MSASSLTSTATAIYRTVYRNDPKFSDRYAWANSADPDQTAPLIRVYTVCNSVCIVWTHYSMVEPHSSNFRMITTNILGVRIFRKFMVFLLFPMDCFRPVVLETILWAPSSEFVSSSIQSLQILTAHAQSFRGARDLAFCLYVPLDSLLV